MLLVVAITETVSPPLFATYTLLPLGLIAIPPVMVAPSEGPTDGPTGIGEPTTVFVAVAITETVLSPAFRT